MMMQMDGGMMDGMMSMGWIWSIVGLLILVLLGLSCRHYEACAVAVSGRDDGMSYGDSPSAKLRTGVEQLTPILQRIFIGEL